MCVKLLKKFVVFASVLVVCSPIFAWAIKPSAQEVKLTEVMTIQENPAVPQLPIVPLKESTEASRLLEEVTAKTRLTTEQAEAIVTLRDAVDELKAINEEYEEENTSLASALATEVAKGKKLRFGLGLGATFKPVKEAELKDMFGAKLLSSVRAGKNQFVVGVEYPEVAKMMEFDATKLSYSVTYIREF